MGDNNLFNVGEGDISKIWKRKNVKLNQIIMKTKVQCVKTQTDQRVRKNHVWEKSDNNGDNIYN